MALLIGTGLADLNRLAQHSSQFVGWVGAGCFRIASNENTHLSSMLSLILPLASPSLFCWKMQASTRVLRLGTGKNLFCFIVLARKVTRPAQIQEVRKYTLPHDEGNGKITLLRMWIEGGR